MAKARNAGTQSLWRVLGLCVGSTLCGVCVRERDANGLKLGVFLGVFVLEATPTAFWLEFCRGCWC
jgi:hypothetical protein